VFRSPQLLLALPLLAACSPPAVGEPMFTDESVARPVRPGAAPRRPSYLGAPTVLYVQLDGAQIALSAQSDASSNQSDVCGATVPPWDPRLDGGSRAAAAGQVRARLLDLFADFNLDVVLERPAAPPYDMIVVGGTASLCGRPDGLGGLGPLDCGNRDLSDVAFVFGATITALDGIVISVAHEAGHSYGLPHTDNPCDVMSNSWCTGGAKRFLDQNMGVPPGDPSGSCALQSSNSWRRLRDVLGPRPAPADTSPPPADTRPPDARQALPEVAAAPGSGCSLAGPSDQPSSRRCGSLLLLLSMLGLLLRRRPSPTRQDVETAHGHSRRDQLGHW
jgi:hypothetical protein